MTDTDYPRVLFITPHAFNHLTGGGLTFTNLFRGWPKDRLATVHCDHLPVTTDVCDQYFTLGRSELDVWRPIRWGADVLSWRTATDISSERDAVRSPAPSSAAGIASRPKWTERVQSVFFDTELPRFARLSPGLEAFIASFRPDVIYTILGSNGVMELIDRVRNRFQLPLVVHVMDDWASSRHRHGLFSSFQRRNMERHLKNLFSAASQRMGIGTAMCEEFERRYGLSFVPFQNAIDLSKWERFARTSGAASGRGDILYIGSVMPNAQLQALEDCCHAVDLLANRGLDASLTIAAPDFQIAQYRERLAIGSAIRLVEPITDDEAFYKRIAAADILLLPVNFDEDSVRFIRYSMPTKVPAYLFSGTPVLAYGPGDIAQTVYASREGWGVVQSARDIPLLAEAIRALLQDEVLRQGLSIRAQAVARENHDQLRVREKFREELAKAAATRGLLT